MKNLRNLLHIIGALLLASPVFGQAVGGNGVVQGTAPAGAAATGNPVQTGGVDSGGKARAFKTDATGQLYVLTSGGSGATAITNQGGTNYLAVDGSGLIGLNNFPSTQAVTQSGSWLLGIFGVNGSSIATAINPFPVSVQGSLPAGTNVIGHVINDASSAVIGHVIADSGTVTANIGTTNGLALDATLTGGTQQTKITDGTNVAGIGPASGSQSSNTYQQVGGTFQSQAFSVSAAGNGTAYDAGGYASVKVQITALYTGSTSVTFQCSNDNANWQSTALVQSSVGTATAVSTTNSVSLFHGPLSGRYFRLVFAGTQSAGSTAGTIVFSTTPDTMQSIGGTVLATQNGTWTVQPGNTPNTTAWKVDGSAVTQPVSGTLNVNLNPAATALNTYSVHLTSNTTTTPTSSTAYISSISISSEVAGTTSTVTIQDKQGTPLKLVNGLSTTTLTTTPTTINFQTPVKMVSGIDIVTAGSVAATVDIWLNYYQ
jgi:hypothetical protein